MMVETISEHKQTPEKSIWCCPTCYSDLVRIPTGWTCDSCRAVRLEVGRVIQACGGDQRTELGERPSWLERLRESVEQGGWEKGTRKLHPLLEPASYWEIITLLRPKRYAWRLLMASKKRERVLCLDNTLGSASIELAKDFKEVYSLSPNLDAAVCVESRLAASSIRNVTAAVSPSIPSLPFKNGVFDVVVITAVEQFIPCHLNTREGARWVRRWIEETRRVLCSEGSLHLAGTNRYGYDRLQSGLFLRRKSSNSQAVSLRATEQSVKQSGFRCRKTYFLLPNLKDCREIMQAGQTQSIPEKDSLRARTRIANRIKSSKWFTPSFFLAASQQSLQASYLEALRVEAYARVGDALGWKSVPEIRRLLVANPDVVILMAGGVAQDERMAVIRIPLTSESLYRCRNNMRVLIDIRKFGGWMETKVPEFLYEGSFHGQSIFIEKGITGQFVVDWNAQVPRLTVEAVDALLELHQRTTKRRKIDNVLYEQILAVSIEKLRPYLSTDDQDKARRIDAYLRRFFIGTELPLVWVHGDYKIENIVFDNKGSQFIGVIDWDLSRAQGLPLLDLLHLLVYNRILRTGEDYRVLIREELISESWNGFERTLLQKYLMTMGINEEYVFPAILIYWLDHLAFRIDTGHTMQYPPGAVHLFSEIAQSALERARL